MRADPFGNPLPPTIHFAHKAYYRVKKNRWYHLGSDYGEALQKALTVEVRFTPEENLATLLLYKARKNARKQKVSCTLTMADIVDLIQGAAGRCQLTGIRFEYLMDGRFHKRPLTPSLDRINPRIGYTPENTRLVCWAVNLALSEYGEDLLRQIASGLLARPKAE